MTLKNVQQIQTTRGIQGKKLQAMEHLNALRLTFSQIDLAV